MRPDSLVLVVAHGRTATGRSRKPELHVAVKGEKKTLCGKRYDRTVVSWRAERWCAVCPSKEERLINPPSTRVPQQ